MFSSANLRLFELCDLFSEPCQRSVWLQFLPAAVKEKVLTSKAFYQKDGWQMSLKDEPGLSSSRHCWRLRANIRADVVLPLVPLLPLIYSCWYCVSFCSLCHLLETELESVSLGAKKPGRFKCVILPRSWQREHRYVYRSVGGSFSLSRHDRFQNDPPKCTLPLSATCDSSLCQLTESRGRIFPWLLSTQRLTKEGLLAAASHRFSYTSHCEEISKASHYCLY